MADTKLPYSDTRCGACWSGLAACHCVGCHQTFTSISGFDAHRTGDTCRNPAEVGMTRSGRTDHAWTFPVDDHDRERLGRLRSKTQCVV